MINRETHGKQEKQEKLFKGNGLAQSAIAVRTNCGYCDCSVRSRRCDVTTFVNTAAAFLTGNISYLISTYTLIAFCGSFNHKM